MRTRKRAYSEEKEKKNLSKFSDSITQFEQPSTKRGRVHKSDMANWDLNDQALLELLVSVVENKDTSMGNKYDKSFYVLFAERLTNTVGATITPDQCILRLRQLRSVFRDYEPQPTHYRHPTMSAALFRDLLTRCFHVPKKPIRLPSGPRLRRPCLSASRRSSSGGSGSCSYSAAGVGTSVHQSILSPMSIPPMSIHMGGYHQELVQTFNTLHSHYELSMNRLIALANFFDGGNNHMLAGILLEKVGPKEQIAFINQLEAAGVLPVA